jgi:hypothetical protein
MRLCVHVLVVAQLAVVDEKPTVDLNRSSNRGVEACLDARFVFR